MASVELLGVLLLAAAPRKKSIGSAQRQPVSQFRSVLRQAEPLTAHPLQPRVFDERKEQRTLACRLTIDARSFTIDQRLLTIDESS